MLGSDGFHLFYPREDARSFTTIKHTETDVLDQIKTVQQQQPEAQLCIRVCAFHRHDQHSVFNLLTFISFASTQGQNMSALCNKIQTFGQLLVRRPRRGFTSMFRLL